MSIGVSIFPRLRTFLKVYIIEQNIFKTEIVGERKKGEREKERACAIRCHKLTCTVKSCAITTVVEIKFFSIELVVLFFLSSDKFIFIMRKSVVFQEKCKINRGGM